MTTNANTASNRRPNVGEPAQFILPNGKPCAATIVRISDPDKRIVSVRLNNEQDAGEYRNGAMVHGVEYADTGQLETGKPETWRYLPEPESAHAAGSSR